MQLTKNIKKQIVSKIKEKLKVKEIILFGSYAWGSPEKFSDIDLLIVLDEIVFFKKYMDRINKKVEITNILYDIEKNWGIDILLYTKDEWRYLLEVNSYFIRNINHNGVRLI